MSDKNESPLGNGKGAGQGAHFPGMITTRTVTVMGLYVKWVRGLEAALDAVRESESGDIAMIERNLVESATEMLGVASEIRGKLRQ